MIQVWRYFATMPSTYTSCQRSIVELLAEVIQEGIDGLKMFFFLLLSFRSFLRTWPSADCGPRVVPRNVLQVEALRNRANDYPAAHPPPPQNPIPKFSAPSSSSSPIPTLSLSLFHCSCGKYFSASTSHSRTRTPTDYRLDGSHGIQPL